MFSQLDLTLLGVLMYCSLRRKILKKEVCYIMTTTLEDMESIPHKISYDDNNFVTRLQRMAHSFQFKKL